jgi:hypothetical protein
MDMANRPLSLSTEMYMITKGDQVSLKENATNLTLLRCWIESCSQKTRDDGRELNVFEARNVSISCGVNQLKKILLPNQFGL